MSDHRQKITVPAIITGPFHSKACELSMYGGALQVLRDQRARLDKEIAQAEEWYELAQKELAALRHQPVKGFRHKRRK